MVEFICNVFLFSTTTLTHFFSVMALMMVGIKILFDKLFDTDLSFKYRNKGVFVILKE